MKNTIITYRHCKIDYSIMRIYRKWYRYITMILKTRAVRLLFYMELIKRVEEKR